MKPMGLFIFLALITALFFVWKKSKEQLYPEEKVFNSFFIAVISYAVGTRFFYSGFDPMGGLVAFLFWLWWYFRKIKDISLLNMFDIYMVGYYLAYIMVEVGKTASFPSDHPVSLYTGLSLTAVLVITHLLKKRIRIPVGFTAIVLLAWFLIINALVDFLKVSSVYYWKVSILQWESIFLLIVLIPIGYKLTGRNIILDIKKIKRRLISK